MVFKADPNVIVDIPLSLIEMNLAWNHRSGNWHEDSGDEVECQVSGLEESIALSGQQEPALVVLTGDPDKPYSLKKGFRRARAVHNLADRGQENPLAPLGHLRCIVAELDELAARTENLRENWTHNPPKPPDFAWGIKQLLKEYKSAMGEAMTGVELSRRLGMSQPHAAKYIRITTKLKANILDRWRTCPVKVSLEDIEYIAALPKDQQDAAFATLIGADVGPGGEGAGDAGPDRLVSVKKKAVKIAELLAKLEKAETISTEGLDWNDHLHLMVKMPIGCDNANCRRSVAAAMRKAYEAVLSDEDGDEDGEEETRG